MARSTRVAQERQSAMARRGLYANIASKKRRIKAGSCEKMKTPGAKGAPTTGQFKRAAQTARKRRK